MTSTAATTSGVANANSAATSARLKRRDAGPSLDDRLPARRARSTWVEELRSTGNSPPSSVAPMSPTTRDLRSNRPQVAFSSWYDDFQIGNRRTVVARIASTAAVAETPGRSRPRTMVPNGPLRLGGAQRAAVNTATL